MSSIENSVDNVRIPPELEVAKALSVNPDDIENETVESIGTCCRCGKSIENWGAGGIHNFSSIIDSWSYPVCRTILLCSECGWRLNKQITEFVYVNR